MSITIDLHWWFAPAMASAAVLLWAVLTPVAPARGDYDFGPLIDTGVRAALTLVAVLVIWLVYFAAMYLTGAA